MGKNKCNPTIKREGKKSMHIETHTHISIYMLIDSTFLIGKKCGPLDGISKILSILSN